MVALGFAWLNSTLVNADSDLVHDDAGLTGGRGARSSCTSASGSARPRDHPAGHGDRRRVPGSSRSR
jgi:hypothetical protein